jgi:hypothetical protein
MSITGQFGVEDAESREVGELETESQNSTAARQHPWFGISRAAVSGKHDSY